MKNFVFLLLILFGCKQAEYPSFPTPQNLKTKNMVEIPELVNEVIPGAPILSQPVQIQGTLEEIMTEKHGYAYPELFDWDRDGMKDLIIGEFETGKTGSYLQVHINHGTNEYPKYTGEYQYAKDVNGDTITAYYWCCIGLHPRFVDLTGDGFDDLVTGSYYPGKIRMWEGSAKGFKSMVEIEQSNYLDKTVYNLPSSSINSMNYWNYTSVDFADFNGDGLFDLFVAGSGGLRCALNIGDSSKPKFGIRELLLDLNGKPLMITNEDKVEHCISGDTKSYITVTDWDNDNVLDLLVTSTYSYEEQNPIEFFRGIKTDRGIRFEDRKPLFERKDGYYKTLPGSGIQVRVVDFNHDGINDLLLGVSILTVNGYDMVDSLAWTHLNKLDLPRIGKDLGAGYGDVNRHDEIVAQFAQYDEIDKPWYYSRPLDKQIKDIYTSRHRGYVYVMYGKQSNTSATLEVKEAKAAQKIKEKEFETVCVKTIEQPHLKIHIERSLSNNYRVPLMIKVTFEMENGWYLYADTPKNREEGYIATEIIAKSDKVSPLNLIRPMIFNPDGVARHEGKKLTFEHDFVITREWYNAKEQSIDLQIKYQTCNKNMCLMPVTINETIKF